jgi:hypothetical protein
MWAAAGRTGRRAAPYLQRELGRRPRPAWALLPPARALHLRTSP